MNIGFISLGCAKNQVDSEEMLSYFARNAFNIVSDPAIADIIVINTCGFLEASIKEAYDVIDEMNEYQKPIVVTGCLAERYEERLRRERPEVALIIPIHDYPNIGYKLAALIKDVDLAGRMEDTKRLYTTPPYQAYLKISDGCDNRCTYCTIPLIRGGFHSVPLETLKLELDILEKDGIKELVVISQDTTRYGTDHPELGVTIVDLLMECLKHEGFIFIRLLYLYPDEITDELIALFKAEPRLTPYFDVPIQHSSDSVLKRMNRRGTRAELLALFKKIREEIPHAVIRTTLIVGFPGETKEDFEDLQAFVDEVSFDHLGVFTYSREKGTPSYLYKEQVPAKIKVARYNKIMRLQAKHAYLNNKKHIGEVVDVLVLDYDEDNLCYRGVVYMFAPDDIDGEFFLYSSKPLNYGDRVKARIVNNSVYDLEAELI